MGEVVLSATGLRKAYLRQTRQSAREVDAVSGVTLEVRTGEVMGIAGRSGSGKTTLISMLAGLLAPTEGTVSFQGQNLYDLGDEARSRLRNESLSVVCQGQTALPDLTVMENVTLPARMYDPDADVRERACALLERLGIAELSETRSSVLSGGECRRMAIARALVVEPKVLFLDEPTADLDDENTSLVLELVREVADAGCAVVLVSHDQAALECGTRLLRMDAGRLSEDGASPS